MLTAEQRAEFERTGIIKLEAVFSAAEAARMRDVVWGELRRRHEIERDDPTTWNRHPPHGLKSSKKHHAFAPIFGATMRAALDGLFGVDGWVMPKHYGQVLVTMPNAATWRVPHRLWHADFQYHANPDDLFAVKYWALFTDMEPGGGATPQLAGSHRATARFLEGREGDQREYKRVRDGFLRSHDWLRALMQNDDDAGRNERFMNDGFDLDGLPLRVMECTGRAGDVYLTHPWVMHSIAVNARTEPRFMRSHAVYAARSASSTGDQRSGSLL